MKIILCKRSRIYFVLGGDIFLAFFSFAAAYYLRFVSFEKFFDRLPPPVLFIIAVIYPAAFYIFGLYLKPGKPWTSELYWRIAIAVAAAAVSLGFLKYVLFLEPIGRGLLFIGSFLFFVLAFIWRSLSPSMFAGGAEPVKVAFIGNDREKTALEEAMRTSGSAYILLPMDGGEGISGLDGNLEIERIILGEREAEKDGTSAWLLHAQASGTDIISFTEMYKNISGRIPIDFIRSEAWFWRAPGFQISQRGPFFRLKQAVDFGLALVLVSATIPLWFVIAVLIKISSKGPVFYRQTRVGRNERVFRLFKFRSMIRNAEEIEPIWAEKNDKRITGVGRILRKLHLDELPQLWNVLRGEMSLVGPRPERPEFVEMLKREIPFYAMRHLVKPGMTGWAQINHPYAASIEDSRLKLEYDLYFIAHMSPAFDLRILLRTVQASGA